MRLKTTLSAMAKRSSTERGAVIAEYVLQLQIILFLILVAIPALKEDIEGTFNEASYAMLPPQGEMLEMTSGPGGETKDPGVEENTNRNPGDGGENHDTERDPGNGTDPSTQRGGGTMATRDGTGAGRGGVETPPVGINRPEHSGPGGGITVF